MKKISSIRRNFSNSVPALVLGVDVSALNIIRSLGRRGIEVFAIGSEPTDYGAVSRYAKFVFCASLTEEDKVVTRLYEFAQNLNKRSVLFCTSDLHVLFVSRNRELIARYFDFVFPSHEVIKTLMNKRNFFSFATRHEFGLPKTFFTQHRLDFDEIAPTLPYPCVVKPLYRTRYYSDHVDPTKKVFKAHSYSQLRHELECLGTLDQPLIFQEWIPGGDEQVFFCLAYLDRLGKPLALFSGRKLRQYPSLTGVTGLAKSIWNQELIAETLSILQAADCRGLCSVEFKYDSASNSFIITEPTVGRVDLQEGISTQAGLDIPFIAYLDALGIRKSIQTSFKTNIIWINEPFELNALLEHSGNAGGKVAEFFRPYKGKRSFALLAADDPRPFFVFLKWAGKRGFRYLKNLAS